MDSTSHSGSGGASRRGNPTPEQLRAREDLAAARNSERERKARTRALIKMGGVASAYGFDTPEQIEAVLAQLVSGPKALSFFRDLGIRETSRWPDG